MFSWLFKNKSEPNWTFIGIMFGYERQDEKNPHMTAIPMYWCHYDYDSLTFRVNTGNCIISGKLREGEKPTLDTFQRYMFVYDANIEDYLDTHPHAGQK